MTRSLCTSAMMMHVSDIEESPSEFSSYLDELLTRLGETNSSAARKAGIHPSLISKWRLGTSKPTIERIRQFADGLNMPRIPMMIRAGLLEPDDAEIPPRIQELLEAYGEINSDEGQERADAHLEILTQYFRTKDTYRK